MDHDRGLAGLVRFRDAPDILRVIRIRETLIMNDDIVRIRPMRILIQINFPARVRARILQNRPLHIRHFSDGLRDRLRLKRVIMTTPSGDNQRPNRLLLPKTIHCRHRTKHRNGPQHGTHSHHASVGLWEGLIQE